MLYDDIISLLNESFRNAHVVSDERVDRRIIADWVMLQRNVFIKNSFNQNGTIEQNTLQFELLTLSTYDPAAVLGGTLHGTSLSLGQTILRTTPCPTIIEGREGVAVYELTSPDMMSRTIQNVSMDRLRWCGNGITNKETVYAAFYDGRWYVNSNSEKHKALTKLRIVAPFADPTQVSTYVRATDDYPVNDFMVAYMLKMVQTEDFSFLNQQKSDTKNNSSGEVDNG
jgi:hypothetical protein